MSNHPFWGDDPSGETAKYDKFCPDCGVGDLSFERCPNSKESCVYCCPCHGDEGS